MAIQYFNGSIGGYLGGECPKCKAQVTPFDEDVVESAKKFYGERYFSPHTCQVQDEEKPDAES